ncbi:MAG: hypothetical protein ACI9EW_003035, partial [Cellvibrionaceae bacterium]
YLEKSAPLLNSLLDNNHEIVLQVGNLQSFLPNPFSCLIEPAINSPNPASTIHPCQQKYCPVMPRPASAASVSGATILL